VKVALCGGGTGGHIYPALSIVAALTEELGMDDIQILYLGQQGGLEGQLVSREGIPFAHIPSGPVRGRWPWQVALSLGKMGVGFWKARQALSGFGADVVLSTGGYAGVPVAVAARSLGIPLVVFLPDVLPGWAVRFMSRLATKVAVSTPYTVSRLANGKVRVTGYPVRRSFWLTDREEGRRRLGLEMEERVLLVLGASQGARPINEAVAHRLRELLELCQVVHISGPAHEPQLRTLADALPQGLRSRYHLYAYMYDEMPWAMAAADLAVCRAGASVLGELPAVGLPAILVPYPYAGGHQRHNAQYLEAEGAALVLDERELRDKLLPMVGLLLADTARRQRMASAMRRLARPDAAVNVARLLLEVTDRT